MNAVDSLGRPLFFVGGVWWVIDRGRPVVLRVPDMARDALLEGPERGTA